MGRLGRTPTRKPAEVAEPLSIKAQMMLRKIKRAQLVRKRKTKHGEAYRPRADFFTGPPMHQGPCVTTEIVADDPGLFARIFKGGKKTYRTLAGKGHRLVGITQFGDRVWHPRYADVKVCLVCNMTLRRVQAPKAGA